MTERELKMEKNCNKRMKLDEEVEDDMEWGDDGYELTAEDFDIAHTQAIHCQAVPQAQPENVSLAVKPSSDEVLESLRKQIKILQDIQDEKQGQISILQIKFQDKCKELTNERVERLSLIELRLKDEVKQKNDLKMKNEKLQTDLQFQNQEKLKLQSKVVKLEKQVKECSVSSPKKLKTSTNSALPKFLNSESFFQEAAISKETKTTQTSIVQQSFKRDTILKNKLSKINNNIRPVIVRETNENCLPRVQQVTPVQINLFGKDNFPKLCTKSIYSLPEASCNNQKLLTCFNQENNKNVTKTLVYENELDVLKNTVIVLEEYLDFIGITFEKQSLSVSIFSGERKLTPEPLEIEFRKWNPDDEIQFDKLCSSVLWVLKYFYRYLNCSCILREKVIKDTANFQPYPLLLRESPCPSNDSNNEIPNNSQRNGVKYSISSVLFASAIPIKIHCKLQNHIIIKTILKIYLVTLKYCDHSCINEYSSLLKNLPLVAYVQSSFPQDISILALELMLIGVRSTTIRDIFNKHRDEDQCFLHYISNSIAGSQNSNSKMVTLKTKLLGDVIRYHGVDHVLNIDGACLRAFMFSFLSWLEQVILDDKICEADLLGYLSFLNIITSIQEPGMRSVEQKMQNFVPIVRHLSYSRVDQSYGETKINTLLKKSTEHFPKYGPID